MCGSLSCGGYWFPLRWAHFFESAISLGGLHWTVHPFFGGRPVFSLGRQASFSTATTAPLPRQRTLGLPAARKVGVRLPGKGNSNSHGARPVHQIITMMK